MAYFPYRKTQRIRNNQIKVCFIILPNTGINFPQHQSNTTFVLMKNILEYLEETAA